MPNPTRQEIIYAHIALEELRDLAEELAVTDGEVQQTRKYHASIFAALPPKPQPTMAEVDWDRDKHFLAEAEHDHFGKVIMVYEYEYSGEINILVDKRDMTNRQFVRPDTLTPTGKRYTLTEVQE